MLIPHLRVIYLHGFASSPSSRKAVFLAERFRESGVQMEIADLADADFENLTISGQLAVVDRVVGHRPAVLIGSSMGGYLAALYAAGHEEIQKLVLLAPAFELADLWRARLGPGEMERWERTDQLAVYHYGEKRERNLKFGFMSDATRYPLAPDFRQPALIFHGDADDTVPVSVSLSFAARHPNVRLIRLASDHELGNVLTQIWQEAAAFLLPHP